MNDAGPCVAQSKRKLGTQRSEPTHAFTARDTRCASRLAHHACQGSERSERWHERAEPKRTKAALDQAHAGLEQDRFASRRKRLLRAPGLGEAHEAKRSGSRLLQYLALVGLTRTENNVFVVLDHDGAPPFRTRSPKDLTG